jgi:hypothetical protein
LSNALRQTVERALAKINPEFVAYFSRSKSVRQLTTFTTQFTTNSPSKNHVLHPIFCKTPCKNTKTGPHKNIRSNSFPHDETPSRAMN